MKGKAKDKVVTFAILQAVTHSFLATKSKEWTLFGTDCAMPASPHPKSATTNDLGLVIKKNI